MVLPRYFKTFLFVFLLTTIFALLGFLSFEKPVAPVVHAQTAPDTAQMDYSSVPDSPAPNTAYAVSVNACNSTSEFFCDYGSGPPQVCPKSPLPLPADPDRNGCFRSGSRVTCNILFPSGGEVEVYAVCNRGGSIEQEDKADNTQTFAVGIPPSNPDQTGVRIDVSPGTVAVDGKTTLTVSSLPQEEEAYNVFVKFTGECASGGLGIGGAQIITGDDGSCSVRNGSGGIWDSTSCTNGQFRGVINASELGVPPDTQTNTVFKACLGHPLGFAEDTFTVTAPDPTDTFSIESILNEDGSTNAQDNPASPGETVEIRLSNTQSGDYGFILASLDQIRTSSCEEGSCSLSLPIPSDIDTAEAEVIVIDPDDNRQSAIVYLESDIDEELPEEEDEEEVISCPVCPDSHKFFDKGRYVCCSQFGCKVPAALLSDEAGLDPRSQVQGLAVYIAAPTTDTCIEKELCWEGKGCIITAENPVKPPCIDDGTVTGSCDEVRFGDQSLFLSFPTTPGGFIQMVLGVLLSISGMVAIALIIRSGYQYMTSRGNPDAIQEARDRLTSAIVGLLFIIFSLVILQVIGVDILQIPGFGN